MKKYKIPVSIQTIASKIIGFVECDNIDEFNELAEKLWEEKGYEHPTINCSNDFDLNDWDISEIENDDLKFNLNT